MHADDAVVHLAATAQVLPSRADRLVAALFRGRFIDAADRFGVSVFARHQLLTLVANAGAIPLD
jgi:hypothetical protein